MWSAGHDEFQHRLNRYAHTPDDRLAIANGIVHRDPLQQVRTFVQGSKLRFPLPGRNARHYGCPQRSASAMPSRSSSIVMARAVGTMAMVSPGRREGGIDTDMGRRSAVLCKPSNGSLHSLLNFTNGTRLSEGSPLEYVLAAFA